VGQFEQLRLKQISKGRRKGEGAFRENGINQKISLRKEIGNGRVLKCKNRAGEEFSLRANVSPLGQHWSGKCREFVGKDTLKGGGGG